MISGTVCDEAQSFERHLPTFDIGVNVVTSGDVADDNSSDDSSIMSRIFEGARDVVVWLGLGNKGVRDLMHGAIFDTDPSPQWINTHAAAIGDLCGRSYWRRLWIFQELKSAKEVRLMCGANTLAWKDFQILLSWVVKVSNNAVDSIIYNPVMSEFVASVRRRICQHVTLSAAQRMVDLCSGGTPTSLWLLLRVTEHLECYDRRDKVYSLLSMAETGCEGIEADYDLPLPRLMHRVLHNLHASCKPPSAHETAIRCARLTEIMEFTRPRGMKDYLAEEKKIVRKEISQDGERS